MLFSRILCPGKEKEKTGQGRENNERQKAEAEDAQSFVLFPVLLPAKSLSRQLQLENAHQFVVGFAFFLSHAERIAESMQSQRRQLLAHVVPMFVFLGLLAFSQLLSGRVGLRHPEFWIYPVQTILCGTLLIWFRRRYEFHRLKNAAFTFLVALVVFLIWIAPQQFFNFPPRIVGYDPTAVSDNAAIFWLSVAFRFLRLVIVVPVMEEIFWRAFLLRFLIDEHFERVPFGKFSWLSFSIVTLVFAFSHSRADWLPGLICGALYNVVAYRSRSLTSCILAHAMTNLLLGLWIMQTGQWGFW